MKNTLKFLFASTAGIALVSSGAFAAQSSDKNTIETSISNSINTAVNATASGTQNSIFANVHQARNSTINLMARGQGNLIGYNTSAYDTNIGSAYTNATLSGQDNALRIFQRGVGSKKPDGSLAPDRLLANVAGTRNNVYIEQQGYSAVSGMPALREDFIRPNSLTVSVGQAGQSSSASSSSANEKLRTEGINLKVVQTFSEDTTAKVSVNGVNKVYRPMDIYQTGVRDASLSVTSNGNENGFRVHQRDVISSGYGLDSSLNLNLQGHQNYSDILQQNQSDSQVNANVVGSQNHTYLQQEGTETYTYNGRSYPGESNVLGVSVNGQRNYTSATQNKTISSDLSLKVNGERNYTAVKQIGVPQVGISDYEARVEVNGNFNSTELEQRGDSQSAFVELTGNRNNVNLSQNGGGNRLDLRADSSGASTGQGNEINVKQRGTDLEATIYSTGTNRIDVTQEGDGYGRIFSSINGLSNVVSLVQMGNQNDMHLHSVGDGNSISLSQNGDYNSMSVRNTGNNNQIDFQQKGNRNYLDVSVNGNNLKNITYTQYGNQQDFLTFR